MGRLVAGDEPIELRATRGGATGPPLAFVADVDGRRYINPLLVARRGAHLRLRLANASGEPTIVHWHGLAVDTVNDGNGETLVAPGVCSITHSRPQSFRPLLVSPASARATAGQTGAGCSAS
jgi:hypothetical protein